MSDDFVIELTCGVDVNGEWVDMVIPDGAERAFKHEEWVSYEELLVGAQCRIVETDDRGANRVTVSQLGDLVDLFTLSLDADEMEINVVNVFNRLASTGAETGAGIVIAIGGLVAGGVLLLVDARRRRARRRV